MTKLSHTTLLFASIAAYAALTQSEMLLKAKASQLALLNESTRVKVNRAYNVTVDEIVESLKAESDDTDKNWCNVEDFPQATSTSQLDSDQSESIIFDLKITLETHADKFQSLIESLDANILTDPIVELSPEDLTMTETVSNHPKVSSDEQNSKGYLLGFGGMMAVSLGAFFS